MKLKLQPDASSAIGGFVRHVGDAETPAKQGRGRPVTRILPTFMSHECRASGSGCEKHSEQHAIADGVELETDQRLLEGGSFIETDAESPREDNNR